MQARKGKGGEGSSDRALPPILRMLMPMTMNPLSKPRYIRAIFGSIAVSVLLLVMAFGFSEFPVGPLIFLNWLVLMGAAYGAFFHPLGERDWRNLLKGIDKQSVRWFGLAFWMFAISGWLIILSGARIV
jgi:hypothetical protein